jgi:phage gp29-like protein
MFNFFNKEKKNLIVTQSKKPIMQEIATHKRVNLYNLLGYLPDQDEILLKTGELYTVYRKLMTDAQIRACIASRKAGTKSLDWDIDRGRDNNPISELIKDYYEEGINFNQFNDDILNAPFFGFQPIEIVWEKVGKYILPKELKAKNPEWFLFDVDGKLRLSAYSTITLGERCPERKFLLPTHNDIHNKYYNPYGDRLLSSCFWPATFKKSGVQWWVTFAEKYGMPYLVGKAGPGANNADKENMKQQLMAMVQDAIAVIESDCELDFISSAQGQAVSASSGIYKELVDLGNYEISKALLGQTLTTDGTQGGTGSFALGKVHSMVRRDIVYGDKKLVENIHNQLIKWIVEINFGSKQICPKFNLYLPEDAKKEVAERDALLIKTGIKFKKEHYIKTYKLDEDEFEIDPSFNTGGQFQPRPKDPSEQGKAEKKIEKDSKMKSEYSEFQEIYTDKIVETFSDKEMQEKMKTAMIPVLKYINSAEDLKTVLDNLDKVSPDMDVFSIEQTITHILFTNQLLGELDVQKEIGD